MTAGGRPGPAAAGASHLDHEQRGATWERCGLLKPHSLPAVTHLLNKAHLLILPTVPPAGDQVLKLRAPYTGHSQLKS